MQIIESTSKRLLREMGVLKNKIESINAQIQGIPVTPKKYRKDRMCELHAERKKVHGQYMEKREEFEMLELLPNEKD